MDKAQKYTEKAFQQMQKLKCQWRNKLASYNSQAYNNLFFIMQYLTIGVFYSLPYSILGSLDFLSAGNGSERSGHLGS